MTYDELAKEIHDDAVAHGWWDTERSADECIALMHCELSEAVEELRNGHAVDEIYYNGGKPEGFAVEIADCVIRAFDYAAHNNFDLTQECYKELNPWANDCRTYYASYSNKRAMADVNLLHSILCSGLTRAGAESYLFCLLDKCERIVYQAKGDTLGSVIRLKMNYNKTRPYKHGKEF